MKSIKLEPFTTSFSHLLTNKVTQAGKLKLRRSTKINNIYGWEWMALNVTVEGVEVNFHDS